MCKFFNAVTSKNLLLTSLLFLFINTSSEADYYAVILAICSEEIGVVFYLKSVKDSYYFSLAIWNSITKEYPNNYASAIRLNVICCGEWQKHNYYHNYILFMRSWIVILYIIQRKQNIEMD